MSQTQNSIAVAVVVIVIATVGKEVQEPLNGVMCIRDGLVYDRRHVDRLYCSVLFCSILVSERCDGTGEERCRPQSETAIPWCGNDEWIVCRLSFVVDCFSWIWCISFSNILWFGGKTKNYERAHFSISSCTCWTGQDSIPPQTFPKGQCFTIFLFKHSSMPDLAKEHVVFLLDFSKAL